MPGARTAATPRIFAVPRNTNKYGGYPRCLNTASAFGIRRTSGTADSSISAAINPVTIQRAVACGFIAEAQLRSSARGERIAIPFASGTPMVMIVPAGESSPNWL